MPADRSERGELAALVRLAVPLAAQQVGLQLMASVDQALLGHYSDAALAAAGIGNNLLFAISSLGMGVMMGLDTIVPQALGAGRTGDARRAIGAGVRLALIVGLALTAAAFAAPLVLAAAHVAPDVVAIAWPYIYVRAIGVTLFLLTIALRSYLAAHHTTRPLLAAVVAGNALNFGLDLALIFGVPALGVPELGATGAALSTTFVQLLTVAVYWAGVRRLDHGAARPKPRASDLRAIVAIGLPVGGQIFAEVGIFSIATVIAGALGTLPADAHSIALALSSFTFSAAVGIASATSVQVGHAIGAGDVPLARRRAGLGLAAGLAVMACFAGAFLIAPGALAGLFASDPVVIAATVPLLHIAAGFQLFDGVQAIAAGALRGLGRTRATFVGNLLGHYLVGVPVLFALGFGAGLGITGVWWGLTAGLGATGACLAVWFFRSTRQSPR